MPVLVKTSYFPNWKASGADGPYRVTPNLMVVIPTSTHVALHYGWTPVDGVAWLLTFVGIGLALLFWARPPLVFPDRRPPRPPDEPQPAMADLPEHEPELVGAAAR